MDPNATWNELGAALRANDLETAREHAGNLLTWLDRGGFPPRDPSAAQNENEARRVAVRRFCLGVLSGEPQGGG